VDHTVGTRKGLPILPVVCLLALHCVVYAQVCATTTATTTRATTRVPVSMRRMADRRDQAQRSVGNRYPADRGMVCRLPSSLPGCGHTGGFFDTDVSQYHVLCR
jgi:hypothetical protein